MTIVKFVLYICFCMAVAIFLAIAGGIHWGTPQMLQYAGYGLYVGILTSFVAVLVITVTE